MERGPSAGHSGEASVEQQRITVQEATRQLGISEHAVRQRIRRRTLDAERDEDGRVYVYLSAPSSNPSGEQYEELSGGQSADSTTSQPGYAELMEEKDARIADLQRQLEAEREARQRADHIIAGLTQRIPELEAANGHSNSYDTDEESHEEPPQRDEQSDEGYTPTEEPAEPQTDSQRHAQKVPWWKRIFGG